MCNENNSKYVNNHEAAKVHPPAASASEIMNRESPMSKMWPFMGGVILGAAGVVVAALVTDRLEHGDGGLLEPDESPTPLALPEGSSSQPQI